VKSFLSAACLFLTGCLGYHVGPVKPGVLRDVHVIAVPTFENKTLLPRIEVLITDSVIKQLQQDGTYKIATEDNADAVLKAEITEINRAPARSVRGNVLATTEFNLIMHVRYKLETRGGTLLMPPTEVVGTTSFFVGTDVTTDERQALPLAAEELATHLVTQLSEGW
jgi:outer membrane lipopolysaccharide assembly protein LptE/RlpB